MIPLMNRHSMWIWRTAAWPKLVYDAQVAAPDLAMAYRMHGVVEGKAMAISVGSTSEVALDALSDDVVATAAIEGERLSLDVVLISRITVGRYRDHDDPIQIVSGMPGREVVHYEAPPSKNVPAQMGRFLAWFTETSPLNGKVFDGLARAANVPRSSVPQRGR
jgi:hypothetical protein